MRVPAAHLYRFERIAALREERVDQHSTLALSWQRSECVWPAEEYLDYEKVKCNVKGQMVLFASVNLTLLWFPARLKCHVQCLCASSCRLIHWCAALAPWLTLTIERCWFKSGSRMKFLSTSL